jgi:carbon-monoxide dehydrogenase medium subunit
MNNFEYRKVSTLEDACLLLDQYGDRAKILAGGTDLLIKMRNRALNPALLIDLKGVPGLDEIRYEPAIGLRIGPLTSIHQLETSRLVQEKFGGIAKAAASLGTYQIRCRATLGGNICSASPAADMVPSLIVLGAKAKIGGKKRERWLPLGELFTGPGRTNLRPEEILAEVQIPDPPGPIVTFYAKHSIRNAMDLAVVSVAVALSPASKRDVCSEIRIALGAVGPVPLRALRAEDLLRGQKLDQEIISRAAEIASEDVQPITDFRASAEYRREMVRVLTRRVLEKIWEGLSGKEGGQ